MGTWIARDHPHLVVRSATFMELASVLVMSLTAMVPGLPATLAVLVVTLRCVVALHLGTERDVLEECAECGESVRRR